MCAMLYFMNKSVIKQIRERGSWFISMLSFAFIYLSCFRVKVY